MRNRLVVTSAAALAFVALTSCSDASAEAKNKKDDKAKEVKVATVESRILPESVTANGTLAADEKITVGTKVAGRVSALFVDLGDRVRRGQPLARIDSTDFNYRAAQASAALAQARAKVGLAGQNGSAAAVRPEESAVVKQAAAQLQQAAANRSRADNLWEEKLISRAQYDDAIAAHSVAESRYQDALEEFRNRQAVVAQRTYEYNLAQQQVSDTTVAAPINGAVAERIASVGEYLPAGAPIATLVRPDPLRLKLAIPERSAASVQVGQTVEVTVDGVATAAGRIARRAPLVDESSRTLMVEAEVANPNGALSPGAFARANVITTKSQSVLIVPRDAIIDFAGIKKVIVVENDTATEKNVKTGRRSGDSVEILEGLSAGEQVVLKPGSLATGQKVKITK